MKSIHHPLILGITLFATAADAHVQVLVPVGSAGDAQPGAVCELDLRFVQHAAQSGPALPMGQSLQFGVVVNNKKTSLMELLKPKQVGGQPAFTARYTLKEVGAHVFYLQPAPYWDADEQAMVTHYAKVIVNSVAAKLPTESQMGWENWEGWDTLVGLPVEIEPRVQCTSLWTGSAFTGIVRVKGKPSPNCRVEVEYLNDNGTVKMPDNSYLTHILLF